MKETKQLIINITATFLAFFTNAAINFILSSYIVNTVSEEAYGFVQLANSFVTYFTVITIAINSMASRFISLEYYKNNVEEAKGYYSATFWANFIVTIISIPIIIIFIVNLEHFVNVSPDLLKDVKVLFAFLSGNLLLGLLTSNLSVSYYIKNKLYIQSVVNMFGYILKAVVLYVMYVLFPPYIAFFGLATLFATSFIQGLNLYYKGKLISELKIEKLKFDKIKILISSGIWNSITRIGNILSEGLDLLITNLYLDASSMGILAIVKIIPNVISSVLSSLISVFMPNMVKVYAQQTKEDFKYLIQKIMKFIGLFLNIPIVCLIVLGDVLFKLWFPTQDATLLQILSVISISQWMIIGPVSIMHNVFTVINKIKTNSLLICFTGVLNIVLVYILLNTTSLGIYAVVGVSSLLSILRNLCYTLPYGAKYIGFKWQTFFPEILCSIVSVIVNSAIGYIIKIFLMPAGWGGLILAGMIICVITLIINIFIFFNKNERDNLFNKIKILRR